MLMAAGFRKEMRRPAHIIPTAIAHWILFRML